MRDPGAFVTAMQVQQSSIDEQGTQASEIGSLSKNSNKRHSVMIKQYGPLS